MKIWLLVKLKVYRFAYRYYSYTSHQMPFMNNMKKLFTPIIHVVFLLPLTGITVGVEMLARETGILGEYKGVIDTPLFITFFMGIIIFGIPLFWLANALIQSIEKSHSRSIYDYLRQSIFFFIIIIFSTTTWISRGFSGNEEDGYLLLWLGISLIAIVINYIFLFRRRKANGT